MDRQEIIEYRIDQPREVSSQCSITFTVNALLRAW
jgi:hypothetical protein